MSYLVNKVKYYFKSYYTKLYDYFIDYRNKYIQITY